MRRREVIAGLIGSAAALPFRVVAQESIPVIGYLSGASREQDLGRLRAFREGLRDAGFLEGRNVAINIGGLTMRERATAQHWLQNWSCGGSR